MEGQQNLNDLQRVTHDYPVAKLGHSHFVLTIEGRACPDLAKIAIMRVCELAESNKLGAIILESMSIVAVLVIQAQSAPVNWVPDSNGSWHVSSNWSSNPLVPGSADDVTIDVGGATVRTITHSQDSDIILSLTLHENLTITGGSVLVLNNLDLVPGSKLRTFGAHFSDAGTGVSTLNEADLQSDNGGSLLLQSAATYAGGQRFNTVVADGANSVIDMSSLTSLAGGNGNHRNAGPFDVKFQALFGGKVDLSNLTAVTGRTQMRAHGTDSVMDLSSLPSISLSKLIVGDDGQLLVPNLTSILQTDVLAQSGGQLDLPSLTNFSGGMEFDTVVATGANSVIDMSSLTSLAGGDGNHRNAGPFDVKFQALFGGKVDLSNLTAVTGRTQPTQMQAHGTDMRNGSFLAAEHFLEQSHRWR